MISMEGVGKVESHHRQIFLTSLFFQGIKVNSIDISMHGITKMFIPIQAKVKVVI